MKGDSKIRLYDTPTFTRKFMPAEEIREMLKGRFNEFFIVRVEEMYRHVERAVPPSRATNHTVIFLTAGEAYMRIGSELYTIHAQEMLIVAAGQIFSFEEYTAAKYNRGFLFHFSPVFLRESLPMLQVYGNPRLVLGAEAGRAAGPLLRRMYTEYSRHGLEHAALLRAYLHALLCEMALVYQPQFQGAAGAKLTTDFLRLLQEHVHTRQRVSDYAALLHVTPNHLNKVVRETTSKSPTRWIDEAILLEAKVLLVQTQLGVGEVAAAAGIEDASYFSRLFKKYEGMTPVEYRRRMSAG